MLEVEGVRFFVDGYNVAMLDWPMSVLAEQRRRLVDTLDLWLSDPTRSRVVANVVFDGADIDTNNTQSKTTKIQIS